MDKDRKKGAEKEVKGSLKQAAGKVTGNKVTEAEGANEKTAGKVQRNIGKAKDEVRDAVKDNNNK